MNYYKKSIPSLCYNQSIYNINRNKTNLYNTRISNSRVFMNEVPVNQEVGYIQVFAFRERGQVPVSNADVTIYARQTALIGTPVMTVKTRVEPITIELPVAHPQGTLITGPEYMFTAYNMTITAPGYSPITVLNFRIFPGITETFDLNMIEVIPGVLPVPEKIISIPPHPRDLLNGQ